MFLIDVFIFHLLVILIKGIHTYGGNYITGTKSITLQWTACVVVLLRLWYQSRCIPFVVCNPTRRMTRVKTENTESANISFLFSSLQNYCKIKQ